MNPGDIGMVKLGDRLSLSAEPGDIIGPVQGVAEHLERHHPIERDLPRLVDDPHPPRAKPAFDHEVANAQQSLGTTPIESLGGSVEDLAVFFHRPHPLSRKLLNGSTQDVNGPRVVGQPLLPGARHGDLDIG